MLENLFSSDEIDIGFAGDGGENLLITFAPISFVPTAEPFWGYNFAKKTGVPIIGITAKRNNWYPRKDMVAARPHLEPVLGRFASRLTYGTSMGGYGALKHSRLLGATATAAFGPQTSLDPADGIRDWSYTKHFDPALHANMKISADDICDDAIMFYDPLEEFDLSNARMIKALAPAITQITLPHAGHECIKIAAGTDKMNALLAHCRAHDFGAVARTSRAYRLTSAARRVGLAMALVGRRTALAHKICEKYSASFDGKQTGMMFDKIALDHMAHHRFDEALQASDVSIAMMPNRSSFVRTRAAVLERMNRLADALDFYRKYNQINPGDALQINAEARVLIKLGRRDLARPVWEKAAQILPTHPNILAIGAQLSSQPSTSG